MKRPILIPPHILGFCVTIEMMFIFVFREYRVITFPFNLIGIIGIVFGQGLIILTHSFMKKHKTTVKYHKSTLLVTEGPFRFSRNPMYLGMEIVLIGLSVLVGNAIGFIFPLLGFAFFQWYFIPFEEQKAGQEFGDDYTNYCKRVRKWI
jgi:protein-S-isoprenylcysteine O-methyltransferase Ste14